MVRRFLLLNGLAVLALVLYHAVPWGYISMFWWPHRYLPVTSPNFSQFNSISYFSLRILEQFATFGLPAFLFVSGFFISFALGRESGDSDFKTAFLRIKKLFVPYLIWSIVLLLLQALQGQIYSPLGYLQNIILGSTVPPYYFVSLLIQLYLLSPLLVRLARGNWKLLLAGSALIQLFTETVIYLPLLGIDLPESLWLFQTSWFFPRLLFWFALGLVFGLHLTKFKAWLLSVKRALPILAITFLILGVFEWEWLLGRSGSDWLAPQTTTLDSLYSATIILTFLAFSNVTIPYSRQLGEIGARSFGVYLLHYTAIEVTARAVYHLAPGLLQYQVLFQPLLWAAGLGFPLLVMATVRWKRSPIRASSAYLFG